MDPRKLGVALGQSLVSKDPRLRKRALSQQNQPVNPVTPAPITTPPFDGTPPFQAPSVIPAPVNKPLASRPPPVIPAPVNKLPAGDSLSFQVSLKNPAVNPHSIGDTLLSQTSPVTPAPSNTHPVGDTLPFQAPQYNSYLASGYTQPAPYSDQYMTTPFGDFPPLRPYPPFQQYGTNQPYNTHSPGSFPPPTANPPTKAPHSLPDTSVPPPTTPQTSISQVPRYASPQFPFSPRTSNMPKVEKRKSRFSDAPPVPLPNPKVLTSDRVGLNYQDRSNNDSSSGRKLQRTSRERMRSRYRSPSRSRRRRSYSRSRSRSPSRSRDRRRSRDRSRSRDRVRSRSRDRRRSRSPRYSSRKSRSRSHDRSSRRSKRSPIESGVVSNERDRLIEKWRRLNCKDDEELEKRLLEISSMDSDQLLAAQSSYWIRSAPATTYYQRDSSSAVLMKSTPKLNQLCTEFKARLIDRPRAIREAQVKDLPPPPLRKLIKCHHHHNHADDSCSNSDEEEMGTEESQIMEELERKMRHPFRLDKELWHNEPGEMNDGPLCKCSVRARRSGMRHGIYAGEAPGVGFFKPDLTNLIGLAPKATNSEEKETGDKKSSKEKSKEKGANGKSRTGYMDINADDLLLSSENCDPNSNNAGKLYHYRITISPPTNFLSQTPTLIHHDGHEFIFTGFSLFSHYPLPKLPVCKVIRFNIEYMILYAEESYPENFTIHECDIFFEYLFREILELVDLDIFPVPGKCPIFHFMPRFVRELEHEGHELLAMSMVLKYLLSSYKPLVPKDLLPDIPSTSDSAWRNIADAVKGMIVTKPGMKPSSIRVDQLDKDVGMDEPNNKIKKEGNAGKTEPIEIQYPEIIHFGIRPSQLSYAGNQEYQKSWREYVKHRHLIANLAKPSIEDKEKLGAKEAELLRMRTKSDMKRDVTATVSSEGFFRTGLMCDVVQHAMLIPVLVCHLRFHRSLNVLERRIGYTFKNRSLLQLALTHPSYRENFGTNPDHARNSLTNCGIRQPEYGDKRIHYMSTKKRGINTLMSIMSRFGTAKERESNIYHNERLEFLGDAVVEFVSTIHLFHMFPDVEEGGLATYRAALVQNQHLAVLAKVFLSFMSEEVGLLCDQSLVGDNFPALQRHFTAAILNLDAYLLYAHGSDLCHDFELNHAMANCFEALMGALFLDGGIDVADRVFGCTVYGDDPKLLDIWQNHPKHPLQEQEPDGDRQWIDKNEFLQNLTKFEDAIGVRFRHIRLLARAFTDKSIGYTLLTLGSNQRLEFLGDSVLQLVASEYLYKHFPDHHEGHLSLLRCSLVNNNTQSVVCDDLGMTAYARYAQSKGDLKIKDKADLLEAFLGALYVDTGNLVYVKTFCDVCFYPRLQDFIMNQEWNDPKSKLQQCCLTLRTMNGGEPDIPFYKVVESKGPTNTRMYMVAVYFRGKRLATASGHSIQQAEMNAAQTAMRHYSDLFPKLDRQKRVALIRRKQSFRARSNTPERYRVRRRHSRRSYSSSSSRSDSSSSRSRSRSRSKKASSSSPSKSPSPPIRGRKKKSPSPAVTKKTVQEDPQVDSPWAAIAEDY